MSPHLSRDLRKRASVIYEQVISLWPESVEIPAGSGLGHLVTIYYEVEDQILNSEIRDDWLRIMNWSIYQTCHEKAVPALEKGATTIQIHNIPLNSILARFTANLSNKKWTRLKSAIEQLACSAHD